MSSDKENGRRRERNVTFNADVEIESLKDVVWRLTTRVFLLEDLIDEKFGEVLGPSGYTKLDGQRAFARKRKQNKEGKMRDREDFANKLRRTTGQSTSQQAQAHTEGEVERLMTEEYDVVVVKNEVLSDSGNDAGVDEDGSLFEGAFDSTNEESDSEAPYDDHASDKDYKVYIRGAPKLEAFQQEPGRRSIGRKPRQELWQYFTTVRDPKTKAIVLNVCKLCGKDVSPKAQRLETHLKKCKDEPDEPSEAVIDELLASASHGSITENEAEEMPVSVELNENVVEGRVRKVGRNKDKIWKHFNTVRDAENKRYLKNTCKICGEQVSPKAFRMLTHIRRCTTGKRRGKSNNHSQKSAALPQALSNADGVQDNRTDFEVETKINQDMNSSKEESVIVMSNSTLNEDGAGTSAGNKPEMMFSAGSRKATNKRSSIWDHFETVTGSRAETYTKNVCKLCGKDVSPKSTRMVKHLEKCEGNIQQTESAPPVVPPPEPPVHPVSQ